MAEMTVSISLKDTEPFKALVEIVKDALEDERIPAEVRTEMEANVQRIFDVNEGGEEP